MRVANMIQGIQYGIQQSEQALNTALTQLSTSRRVNELADDPAAAAAMVQALAASSANDRYSSNISSVEGRMQATGSALSTVVTALNSAITVGTGGTDATLTTSNRQGLANQVQGILQTVVSQANLSYQGVYLFAGSNTTTVPFIAISTGYTYNGDSATNTVQVGASTSVATNLPGDQVFTSGANVIGSLQALVTALQTGTAADVSTATSAVSAALQYVGEQRAPLDNSITQLNAQDTYLSQESVTLTTLQTKLVGIDTATAATNLSQAQLTHNAVLAAAAKAVPETLLDYLR